MSTQQTICLIMDRNDRLWVEDYLKVHSKDEEITIIALTFEGIVTAKNLNLKYKTYEETAWKINKNDLYDKARIKAFEWFETEELSKDTEFCSIKQYKDFPLLVMHQSRLLQSFYEIIFSFEFVKKIFESEKPDKVVIGERDNPFEKRVGFYAFSSNTVEREVAEVMADFKKIEFVKIPVACPNEIKKIKSFFCIFRIMKFVIKKIKYEFFILYKKLNQINVKSFKNKYANLKDDENRILFFTHGGYYFNQINGTIDYLLKKNIKILIIVTGGKISKNEIKNLNKKSVDIFFKEDLKLNDEKNILIEWEKKLKKIFENISNMKTLITYFSDDNCSYFKRLIEEAVKTELINNLPETIVELERSSEIINGFKPNLVVAHFARHPLESCDVLPARKLGIPTLNLCHGIGGYAHSTRETFATQFFATHGQAYKEALIKSLKCDKKTIFSVGESRLENIKIDYDIKRYKNMYGFDSERPLCIFCDCSQWTLLQEYKHSTYKTFKNILNLKRSIPEIQIIYRVHHGGNYDFMKKFFQNNTDIEFHISPNPLFTDIVKAADVVISHHSSVITETLLNGVPVVYLCALSEIEAINIDPSIKFVDNYELLNDSVKEILGKKLKREEVRKSAKNYFKKVLSGNDGKSTKRLSELILNLSKIPRDKWEYGFEDWIQRIRNSCQFKSDYWMDYSMEKIKMRLIDE